MRMKIATFALVLGLGGLGGYAMSSSGTATQTSAEPATPTTQVIRRTVHAKPRHPKAKASGSPGGSQAAPSQSYASQPVSTGSSGSGSSAPPVSTGSSGGGGGGGGYEREGGESEGGGEGGDD